MKLKTRLPDYGFRPARLLLSYSDHAIYGQLFMDLHASGIRRPGGNMTISSVRLEDVPDLCLPIELSLAPTPCRPDLTP
jgi:hypothetical protein